MENSEKIDRRKPGGQGLDLDLPYAKGQAGDSVDGPKSSLTE